MKLHVGQRLQGTGLAHQAGGYVVTEVVAETPWFGLYGGKKILTNFDFAAKRVRETDDREWLNVYLRTVRYAILDDPAYVASRRELARGEVRRLGIQRSNLWPEPLDLLEIDNTIDRFGPEIGPGEPVVVFARPQGKLFSEWMAARPPMASILAVFAELLGFIAQAHKDGMMLHGLGLAALLIDRADRVHYLGGDVAVETERIRAPDPAAWVRLFPPERYPRGIAAPESFAGRPEPRGDLYAWAALALSALTGLRPWQIASEQGRLWAQFHEAHFRRLDRVFSGLPAGVVETWAEQLGVAPAKVRSGWPGNAGNLFRALLQVDPQRRPGSVEDIRQWLEKPPLAPPRALLAFLQDAGQGRIYCDLEGTQPALEMIIQRGAGSAPISPNEGTRVFAGPGAGVVNDDQVPLTPEPIYYSCFLRHTGPDGSVLSTAAVTELLESSPAAFRRLAEAEAASPDQKELPARLGLAFAAIGRLPLAEAWWSSSVSQVRRWALECLPPVLDSAAADKAETFLTQAAQDADPDLRLIAGQWLLERSDPSDEAYALGLIRHMGRSDLDESLAVAQALRQRGIRPEQMARLQRVLEGERPAVCPVCRIQLAHKDRAAHLRQVHDYVDVGGHLLPRDQAAARLWARVHDQADAAAHEHLLRIFARDMAGYVRSLEMELAQRPGLDGPSGPESSAGALAALKPYYESLGQTTAAWEAAEHLLRSIYTLVRTIGREAVTPLLVERLQAAKPQAIDLRRELEELCPGAELLEERLAWCTRLAELGIDSDTVESCRVQMSQDRRITCDVCRATVRLGDWDTHLRRAHQIFQFRGQRRTFDATRMALLESVCSTRPDPAAWEALQELAEDRHPRYGDQHVVTWVCAKLRTTGYDRDQRHAVVHAVGQTVAQSPAWPRLLPVLAGPLKHAQLEPAARVLALEISSHLPGPPPRIVVQAVKPLLSIKTLPRQTRENAMVGLLGAVGKDTNTAAELLEAYVAESGKLRGIAKLQELEQRVGHSAAIDIVVARLEDLVRMDCPRCGTQLQRKDMVHHLWERHRLVLEGRRVREPWHQLADWVVDYSLEKDEAILERCRELARKVDGERGLERLERLLLRHGVAQRDVLKKFLDQARTANAGLCPHCFGNVPVPQDLALPQVHWEDQTLEGHGIGLSLSGKGLLNYVLLETPEGSMKRREPGRPMTRLGGLLFLAAPLVLALGVVLKLAAGAVLPTEIILLLTSGAAFLGGGLTWLLWPKPPPLPDRLIDLAWSELVPLLTETSWTRAKLAFVAGLSQLSRDQGDADERSGILEEIHDAWTAAAATQEQVLAPLLALNLLRLRDAERDPGLDPVVLLAAEVDRALAGTFPLRWAGQLAREWLESRPVDGQRRRVQALVQAYAFNRGLEVKDLIDLAKAHPGLGVVLGLDDIDLLAQRRRLWSLGGGAWRTWSKAESVFDLAGRGAMGWFNRHADLLAASSESGIALTSQGIRVEDICIDDGPHRVDVVRVRDGFEIQAGRHRAFFSVNPNRIADELERWQTLYFQEFLPQVAALSQRPASDLGKQLRKNNSLPCASCGRWVLTRPGEVGVLATVDQ